MEHILLILLEESASGYELKREFEAGAMTFWPALPSQIYSTLQRMEGNGLLRSTRESSNRGPDRRAYSRTDAGQTELDKWLRSGPQIGRERFAYLAQLSGIGLLNEPAVGVDFLIQLRHWFTERLEYLKGFETAVLEDHTPESLDNAEFFDWAALQMGISVLEARARCCTELLETLKRRLPEVEPDENAASSASLVEP